MLKAQPNNYPKGLNCSWWKHGESNANTTPEYKAYTEMIGRCYNPNHPAYKRYGGRGIIVANRWKGIYYNFLEDMGRRPSNKHTLGRIDNNGNYEPSNCRWETRREQNRNQSTTRLTMSKAREVRKLYATGGWTQRELARKFNVSSKTTITDIVNNRIWQEEF